MLVYSGRVILENATNVSHRELLLAMRLLLSMGVSAYNSGSPVTLGELHELESDIDQMQAEMVVL